MSFWSHVFPICYMVSLILTQATAQITNYSLTSDTHSITLTFQPEPDTNYTVSFVLEGGFYFFDLQFNPPYSQAISAVHSKDVVAGNPYHILVHENFTVDTVLDLRKAAAPFTQERLSVTERGTDFLTIEWRDPSNLTYDAYEIAYRKGNDGLSHARSNTNVTSYTLTGLSPGYLYDIYVIAVAKDSDLGLVDTEEHSTKSETYHTATLPEKPANLIVYAENTTHLTALWQPANNSYQDSFQVSYTTQISPNKNLTTCLDSPCTFMPGPPAGQLVTTYVAAVSYNNTGQDQTIVHTTRPESPRDLRAYEGIRSLNLTWAKPMGSIQNSYRVNVTSILGHTSETFNVSDVDDGRVYFYIDGLRGGHTYSVAVAAKTDYETGEDFLQIFRTFPEPVSNVTAVSLNTTAFEVSWRNPDFYTDYNGIFINVTGSDDKINLIFDEFPRTTSRIVADLTPGERYRVEIEVSSHIGKRKSQPETVYVRTKPVHPSIKSYSSSEDSINITVSLSEDIGVYDSIRGFIVGTDISHITMASDESSTMTFSDLDPGNKFEFEIVTLSGDEKSESVTAVLFTRPRPPRELSVVSVNESSIQVSWLDPDMGGFDNFTVTLTANLSSQPKVETVAELKVTFTDLVPGTTYNVSVVTNKGDQVSDAIYGENTTYPESVAALQKVDATTENITVNWTIPLEGNFDNFWLGIQAQPDALQPEKRVYRVSKERTNATFGRLQAGELYTIAIRTWKQQGNYYGAVVRLLALTKPKPVENLVIVTNGTSHLVVTWEVAENTTQDSFVVVHKLKDGTAGQSKSEEVKMSNTTDTLQTTLFDLVPGSEYQVEVKAVRSVETDTEESETEVAFGQTIPLPVGNVTSEPPGEEQVRVTWTEPDLGDYTAYNLYYRSISGQSGPDYKFDKTDKSTRSRTISDLFPGNTYEVILKVESHGQLESEGVSLIVTTRPKVPEQVTIESVETDNAIIGWRYDRQSTLVDKWSVHYSNTSQQVMVAEDIDDYTAKLSELVPGERYTGYILAVSSGQNSQQKTFELTAKPVLNTALREISSSTSSLTVGYTVAVDDIFSQFSFLVKEIPGFRPFSKPKDDPDRKLEFKDLTAGTRYTIQVKTISNEVESDPADFHFLTDPSSVPVQTTATARAVTIILGTQVGSADEYRVACLGNGGASCGTQTSDSDETQLVFGQLNPYTDYEFQVVTYTVSVNGKRKNVSQTYTKKTAEAAPSAVNSLQVSSPDIHKVSLSWLPPSQANGQLRYYYVMFQGRDPNFPSAPVHKDLKQLSVSQTSLTLENMKAGYEYMFSVFANTTEQGPASNQSITMGTLAPAFKAKMNAENSKPAKPEKKAVVTENSISVTFLNPFDSVNGYVSNYVVIVSTDPDVDDSTTKLPSWQDAKKDKSIKFYQIFNDCKDFFSESSSCSPGSARSRRAVNELDSRVFVLGEMTESQCRDVQFCNGQLNSDTGYYVKLRGYTAPDQYTETVYSEKISTAKGSSSNAGLISGIVVSIVVVIIVMVVIITVTIRRRRKCPKKAVKHTGPRMPFEQSTLSKLSRPVKLSEFPIHCRKMSADSDLKYAEEYEDLKEVGRDQPCSAAEFPPNRPKNRFTNILPYDHSRVKLLPTDDEEGSDYINANYMPGYNSLREYIATQGPLPATRDDFWRMVWEQRSRNIVMLTKCHEKGREKSDHYWPNDSEPKFYGDLQVVILNETHMPDWTVTEFKVSLGDQSRTVRHFHYTVWPDFGVPQDKTSVVRFVRTVRERMIREGAPIVTHCSAGVGRSGTFIVLDHLLQLIREKDEVDIFSIVYKLRKERVLMVQTEQQYKFVHDCLLCVLEGREEDTTYANVGQINAGFEDDEGINVELP